MKIESMEFCGQNLLAVSGLLALALLCGGCGGGAGASTLSPGGGGPGSGGSGSGSGAGSGSNKQSACSAMSTGQGASLNCFPPFVSDNLWNKDVSGSSVDANSDAIISFIGPSIGLHPDSGSGQYQGSNIGIPYVVVGGAQAQVNVGFTAYGDESDPGPMPIPGHCPLEVRS